MKLKHVLTIGVVFCLVIILLAPTYAQTIKIGYVNSQKIFTTYKEFLDAQKQIEDLRRQWENEILSKQKELEQLYENFQSQNMLLSDSKKIERQQEMQELDIQIKQMYQERFAPGEGEIYKRQENLLQPINEKINKLIEKIGSEANFDLIYDEAGGNLVYVNKSIKQDLTDKLLGELEKPAAEKTK